MKKIHPKKPSPIFSAIGEPGTLLDRSSLKTRASVIGRPQRTLDYFCSRKKYTHISSRFELIDLRDFGEEEEGRSRSCLLFFG